MFDCTQILTEINKVRRDLISHQGSVRWSLGSVRAQGHAQGPNQTAC